MAIAWNCGSDQVGPVVTATVVVTPAQASAASLGEIISFSAVARDGTGAAIAGAAFTWSSSNTTVATVDGNGAATVVGNGTTQITATSAGVTGSATLTVAQAVASMEVTPSTATLTAISERRQFSAQALDANGNPLTTQPAFVWTESSAGAVATINAGGLATAIADGTTQVTASAAGVSASGDLTVAQAISSITVTPAAAVLGSIGDTQQFSAEARDAMDYPLGNQPSFIWTSANQAVATVNSSTGLAVAVAVGTTDISAAAGGVTGSADLSVAPTLSTIVVTPATANLDAIGSQQQFTAEARDGNGNPLPVQPTFVWTESSAGGVATIDANGLTTATGNGTTQVTATWGGTSGSASLTVAQVASSILVTPATATLTSIGSTQQFTAVVRDANDHALATQPSLTWASTNQTVATVHLISGLATSHALGTAQITATAAGLVGHADLTVTQTIGSIVVTPAAASLTALGATQQFTAVALDGVGTPLAVQPSFTWGSSNETVATVDPSTGLATAVALGSTQITASAGGATGNANLSVTQPIGSVVVTPAAATLDAIGAQQQFSAVALDGIGTPLSIQPNFTWASTDDAIATVDVITGLATAVADGSVQITASAGGVTGSADLTVAQAIGSIVVTPAVATVDAIGATQQFTAEARDLNGNPLATQPTFTWGSANHPVATVSLTTGLATAQGVGIAEISASAGGVIGTAELTVTQAVSSIVVTPATATLDAIDDTQQFSAEARDANDNPLLTQPAFVWAETSSGAVATVAGNGLATATGNGTTQVTASAGGATGSADLTVSQVMSMIGVDPPAVTLTAVGVTQQFNAEAQDANGNPMPTQPSFTWASSDQTVATVDVTTGLATSQAMGTTQITATASGFTGVAGLTVTQAISSIVVTPATATLEAIGAEQQFAAEARDAAGTPLAIQPMFTWGSGDDAVATVVVTTGLATAQGNGATQISASAGGVTGSADLTVAQTATSVVVTPDPATMSAIGATLQFSAEAQDANGNPLATQPTFAWTENSSGAVATIDGASGLATAVANGTTQVTATGGGVSGNASLTVAQAINAVVVTPGTVTVTAIGATQQFTAEAQDINGNPLATQPTFAWTENSSGAVATIDGATGLATAVANGTTQVTATGGGVSGNASLTVAQTINAVVVTPDTVTLTAFGATQQFTAEAQDINGNPLATQPTFAWTENSSGAVATIDGATGLATAVANGTAQVTATGGGVSGNGDLTVAQTTDSIAVTPATATLDAIGATQLFSAEAFDANGNLLVVQPASFDWTSSDEAVATVDPAAGATTTATATGNGPTQIEATVDGVTGSATLTVTQVIDQIVVTFNPVSPLGFIGATTTASAEARDANGNPLVAQPASFDWVSTDEAVVTVDPAAGATTTATAVSTGSSDITATADGVTGSAPLTVAQTIDNILVTFNPASPLDAVGATTTVSAVARDASNTPLVPQPASFDWASTDEAVATVDPAAGATTTATAVSSGTTQIEATAGGVTGSASLTVTQTVDQILVTLNPVGPFDAFGATTVASAEARDGNGNPLVPQPTSFDWASTDVLVATVAPAAGATTTATTVGNGTAQIQATSGGVTGSADLTVAQVATSVAITPTAATLTAAGNTQQFTAETRDANDSALTTQPTFTWTENSAGTVATINASTGLATAVAEGTTTITATASSPAGLTGTATLNVSAVTIVVTPALDTLDRFEHEVWFSAEASDAYGPLDPQPAFTWTVTSGGTIVNITEIDAVTPGAKVMAMANGTDSIIASALGVADTAEAVVQQRTFVVEVTPASANLNIGETQSFSAVAKDENGYDLVTQPTVFAWASTDVAIATVAPDTALTTIATAVANGTVAVTATDTAAGVTGSATVRVGPTTGVFWLGGDGSWNDAGNWSSGTVPTSADDVVIDVGGNYTVYLVSAGSANSVTLGATTGTQSLEVWNQNLTVAGTLTIGANGVLSTRFGTVTATLDNQGLWEMYDDGSVLGGTGRAHVNSGTINATFGDLTINLDGSTFSNEGPFIATAPVTINQTGTGPSFTLAGSSDLTIGTGQTLTVNGGTFNNNGGTIDGALGYGTLALVGATGNLNTGIQTSNVQLDLTNAILNGPATLQTDHTDLRTYVDNSTINASISNYETIYVSNNTFFAGATTVNSGTGHIYGTGTLDITGTTFTNQGRIDPAGYNGGDPDPSTLTISGNLVQSSSAEIYIDIKDAGVFDVLAVTGSATLNGTLDAHQFAGSTFEPTSGQEFVVMTFASSSGSFVNTTVQVGGATLDIVYTSTSVKLVAQ
jgi:uncharacterized protein YjdB